jgi:hypothetical protein
MTSHIKSYPYFHSGFFLHCMGTSLPLIKPLMSPIRYFSSSKNTFDTRLKHMCMEYMYTEREYLHKTKNNNNNTTTDACLYMLYVKSTYLCMHISSHTHLANMLIVRGSLSREGMCIGKLLATVSIVRYLVVFDLGPHFLIQES